MRDSDKKTVYDKLKYCLKDLVFVRPVSQTKICNICCDILRVTFEFKRRCLENNKNLVKNVKKLSQSSGNYSESFVLLNDSVFYRYKNYSAVKEVDEDKQNGARDKVSPENDLSKYLSMYDLIKLFPKKDRRENVEEINLSCSKENGGSSNKNKMKNKALKSNLQIRLERLDEKIINDLQKRNEEEDKTEEIPINIEAEEENKTSIEERSSRGQNLAINREEIPINIEETPHVEKQNKSSNEERSSREKNLEINRVDVPINIEETIPVEKENKSSNKDRSSKEHTEANSEERYQILRQALRKEEGPKDATVTFIEDGIFLIEDKEQVVQKENTDIEDFLSSVLSDKFKTDKNDSDRNLKRILSGFENLKKQFSKNEDLIKRLVVNHLKDGIGSKNKDTNNRVVDFEDLINVQPISKDKTPNESPKPIFAFQIPNTPTNNRSLLKKVQPIETSVDFEAMIGSSTIFEPTIKKNVCEKPRRLKICANIKKRRRYKVQKDLLQQTENQIAGLFGTSVLMGAPNILSEHNIKTVLHTRQMLLRNLFVAKEEIVQEQEEIQSISLVRNPFAEEEALFEIVIKEEEPNKFSSTQPNIEEGVSSVNISLREHDYAFKTASVIEDMPSLACSTQKTTNKGQTEQLDPTKNPKQIIELTCDQLEKQNTVLNLKISDVISVNSSATQSTANKRQIEQLDPTENPKRIKESSCDQPPKQNTVLDLKISDVISVTSPATQKTANKRPIDQLGPTKNPKRIKESSSDQPAEQNTILNLKISDVTTVNKLKTHRCFTCDKTFICTTSLSLHMATHSKIYECSICNVKFKFKYCLVKHLSQHKGEKVYTCPFCPKEYGRVEELKYHCIDVHQYVPFHFQSKIYKGPDVNKTNELE